MEAGQRGTLLVRQSRAQGIRPERGLRIRSSWKVSLEGVGGRAGINAGHATFNALGQSTTWPETAYSQTTSPAPYRRGRRWRAVFRANASPEIPYSDSGLQVYESAA